MNKSLLVVTDFSPPAEAALQQAVWLARKTGASITLAHTLPTQHSSPSETGPKMDLLVIQGESLEDVETKDPKGHCTFVGGVAYLSGAFVHGVF